MKRQPIFVLSLPRSGSTLVQRVLASHDEIATTPEPWFLLPQVYALRERGIVAEYVQVSSVRAIREFADGLPNGLDDYRAEVRELALRLYDRAASGEGRYFLDKTPRYHLIIDDLFELFPEAQFIFLWRNPLAVAASIVETWAKGRWAVQRWHVDLYGGVENLVEGYRAHSEHALAVRFEDLVSSSPLDTWSRVFAHLDLGFDEALLVDFADLKLTARMGDPTGQERYRTLDVEPIQKWRTTLATPVRKRWSRGYLEWIGRDRLSIMGYDLDDLLSELDTVPTELRRSASDVARGLYWWADRASRERASRLMWRRLPR